MPVHCSVQLHTGRIKKLPVRLVSGIQSDYKESFIPEVYPIEVTQNTMRCPERR